MQEYIKYNKRDYFWIETGRGCVHKCGFCISSKHWGHRSRYYSVDKIINDIKSLKESGISSIRFTHDQFTANNKFVKELCFYLKDLNLQINWACYSRVDELTENKIVLMASAGCKQIFVGLESSINSIQNDLKKNIDESQLNHIIHLCQENGVELESNIIFGLPEHEENNILNELAFGCYLKCNNFSRLSLTPLELYPGTPFYKSKKYFNLFEMDRPYDTDLIDLFSFNLKIKKRYWGMVSEVVIEYFRYYINYLPQTILYILKNQDFTALLKKFIKINSNILTKIYESDLNTNAVDFFQLFFDFWKKEPIIVNIYFIELAITLVTIQEKQSLVLSTHKDLSFKYISKHVRANISCSCTLNKNGIVDLSGDLTTIRNYLVYSDDQNILIVEE